MQFTSQNGNITALACFSLIVINQYITEPLMDGLLTEVECTGPANCLDYGKDAQQWKPICLAS